MKPIISEFIGALDEEIATLKAGKGGNITKIFEGKHIREVPHGHVYLFHLENFLATVDDSPAEIEVNGQRFQAQILMTQGLEVHICIDDYCGETIAEAKLYTNFWFLLELLKKKFENSENLESRFRISEALFSGDNSIFPVGNNEVALSYSPSEHRPDPSQEKAIRHSYSNPLSIIWGPPGTGKTTTIAKAIEAHLNAGRKVLLVSHANNAVDQALLDIAKQMKNTSFYNNGELVRLGIPAEHAILGEFEKEHEMVLMDKISAKLGESLIKEKGQLLEKEEDSQARIDGLREISDKIATSNALNKESESTTKDIQQIENQLNQAYQKYNQLKFEKQTQQAKLQEAQSLGIFARLLKGMNLERIQSTIDSLTVSLDSYERQIIGLKQQLSEFQTKYTKDRAELEKIQQEIDTFLKDHGVVSIGQIDDELSVLENTLQEISKRIGDIEKTLEEMQLNILRNAKLVATTLTKTFSDKRFEELQFDVLFVDEASMAPLPYVFWAASKCTGFVTIAGDFLQLPPIAISKGPMSKKWLARSIFEVLNISTVEEATKNPLVNLLDTQYRMIPEIGEIPKNFFYNGKLNHGDITKTKYIDDGISDKPLVLIKTDDMNPWCSRLSAGSRFNLYHAIVSATLAKQLITKGGIERVGIVTPYSAQARLINLITKDWGLMNKVKASTVHRFQGGEEPVIIFDTVEATGTYIAPMLDSTKADSDASLLLNVAITRAKSKFYIISHTKHLLSGLNPHSSLTRIIKYFEENGEIKQSNEFVDSYLTTDFEKYIQTAPIAPQEKNEGSFFTEKNFYGQFNEDLNGCKERIIILSPFLSINRSACFMDRFQNYIAKGIEIRVYTRPREQQTGAMVQQAEVVIDQLRAIGAKVFERKSMHQKVAIIDNCVAWEGSLNILSHHDSGEQMRRFEGPSTIKEIIKGLELDQNDGAGTFSEKICPECGKSMVFRQSRFGKFLACSGYPKCKYIDKGNKKPRRTATKKKR